MQESLPEIRRLLGELSSIPPETDENVDLYRDLGMPSVKAMELLYKLEEVFGITVPDDDFVEATTMRKLADMVDRVRS